MQILAVDIGTSMQNILLYDGSQDVLRVTMPSPTALVARAIRAAKRRGEDVYLTGVTMGAGPCMWAVRDHVAAGHRVYATADAAQTFGERVDDLGVILIDGGDRPRGAIRLEMHDFDLSTIEHVFLAFGARARPDAIALAVFDHGSPPSGTSEQAFRFTHLTQRLRTQPDLTALAYMRADIPADMPRMRAVAASAPPTVPLMVMDTAFAALLGSQQDPEVHARDQAVLLHLGTMHTTALHIHDGAIAGLFEHQTARLSPVKLDGLLASLVGGTLTCERVAADGGHGAMVLSDTPARLDFLAVTGPMYNLVCGSGYTPYFAAPGGAGVAPGCWGLLCAYAALNPGSSLEIDAPTA
jgi:uncharacterized protein (DUF1786 family)